MKEKKRVEREAPEGRAKPLETEFVVGCFGLSMVFGDSIWTDLAKPPTGYMNGWNDCITSVMSYRPC